MKILWVAATVAAVALGWRFASRRRSLPCPVWLRWMVELDNPFAPVCRARAIVEHLDLAPGMTVLDGGCGPGRVTVPLARAVGPRMSSEAAGFRERAFFGGSLAYTIHFERPRS